MPRGESVIACQTSLPRTLRVVPLPGIQKVCSLRYLQVSARLILNTGGKGEATRKTETGTLHHLQDVGNRHSKQQTPCVGISIACHQLGVHPAPESTYISCVVSKSAAFINLKCSTLNGRHTKFLPPSIDASGGSEYRVQSMKSKAIKKIDDACTVLDSTTCKTHFTLFLLQHQNTTEVLNTCAEIDPLRDAFSSKFDSPFSLCFRVLRG